MKEKKITITLDELAEAHAKGIVCMMKRNPVAVMLADDFSELAAITAHILFDEKED